MSGRDRARTAPEKTLGKHAAGITVAKYLRISNEDTDRGQTAKTESDSIVNQRSLLDDFISRTPEFAGADIIE